MKVQPVIRRITILLIACVLFIGFVPIKASAKTVTEWLEGFDTGASWFGDDFHYDITDTQACWALLMQPITVLDIPENESVYPLDTPNGEKVNNDKLGGFINGASAAVHVLGPDENGWTLIEGLDYYNRMIRGYVKTSILKEIVPDAHYGIIIDKMTQQLYVFIDGAFFSSCEVSTGLANDKQPYNETAAGEYVLISWSGGFDAEGMYCDMAIRFNNGDKMHEVPGVVRADGSLDYSRYEPLLGSKASHGCVRVARIANEDGLNMKWLWDNLKRGTKVVIWDDGGREKPYPDDDMPLYYNPNGGRNYHSEEYCNAVKDRYLPLTGFTYGELDDEPYDKLTPCPYCCDVMRKDEIDLDNLQRGAITQDEYDERQAARHGGETGEASSVDAETPSAPAASMENIVITISTTDD